MRRGMRLGLLGAAAGLVATAALGGAAAVLVPGSGLPEGDRAATLASPSDPPGAGLVRFTDCAQLRRWYVQAALRDVDGWGLRIRPLPSGLPGRDAFGGGPAPGADVAATDGRLVVRLDGRDLVITDVRGAAPRELSRTTVPGLLWGGGVVLDGTRAAVVGTRHLLDLDHPRLAPPPPPAFPGPPGSRAGRGPARAPGPGTGPGTGGRPVATDRLSRITEVVPVDLTDPGAPRLLPATAIDGAPLSVRLHEDGVLRVVVRKAAPSLRLARPGPGLRPETAERENRRLVRAAPAAAWLPGVGPVGGPRRTPACSEVWHPRRPSGSGTVTVTALDLAAPGPPVSTAVATPARLALSSGDRVHLVSASGGSSTVHTFAATAAGTSYVGSVGVPGSVRGAGALDLCEGRLRVVSALSGTGRSRPGAAVTVVTERDGGLAAGDTVTVPATTGLRPVGWVRDRVVLTTLAPGAPGRAVDLSDPDRPRLLPPLPVLGPPVHLRGLGDSSMLWLAQRPTGGQTGAQTGAPAAGPAADAMRGAVLEAVLVDVGDPGTTQPFRLGLGAGTALGAAAEPRSLAWLPSPAVVVLAVHTRPAGNEFVALGVGPDGTLRRVATWPATDQRPPSTLRTLALADGRVALVDSRVRVVRLPGPA